MLGTSQRVLGPRRGQVKKRWYFGLRIQLGYIALVQTVLWVTCFLLWPGNWGEILLYGVLSKSQVLQSPHRVVPSQPAELYIIPIVAPCRVKGYPDQCKKVADWTGLENAEAETTEARSWWCKSKDDPMRNLAWFLECDHSVCPEWDSLLGLTTVSEGQFCAEHSIHLADGKWLEMASIIIQMIFFEHVSVNSQRSIVAIAFQDSLTFWRGFSGTFGLFIFSYWHNTTKKEPPKTFSHLLYWCLQA